MSWIKTTFRKLLGIKEGEVFSARRCGIHPQVGTKDVDRAIYYAVDEYTDSAYVKLVEDLSQIEFLTIIGRSPLTFQIGTSNVIISPERYGKGVIYQSAVVVRRPSSFADPNGFLRFERQGDISFEEAFERLNEKDQEDVIYALDVLGGRVDV